MIISLGSIKHPYLEAGGFQFNSVVFRRIAQRFCATIASALTALHTPTHPKRLESCCSMSTLGLRASESCANRMFQIHDDQVRGDSISTRSEQSRQGDVHGRSCMHEPITGSLHLFRIRLFPSHSNLGPPSHAFIQPIVTTVLCRLGIEVLYP